MRFLRPPDWNAQLTAFLASIPRRVEALGDVPALDPFDPELIAAAFIARIEEHVSAAQLVHIYADAMMSVEPGSRKAWKKINTEVERVSWPLGLAYVQQIAAEINRNRGMMPFPSTPVLEYI
jgi:hypothetical protein